MSIAFFADHPGGGRHAGTGAVYSTLRACPAAPGPASFAAFGCILGVLPHMLAGITGLAAVLHAPAIAFQVIKWLGVAYLLYLAWQTLRDQSAIQVEDNPPPCRSGGSSVSRC